VVSFTLRQPKPPERAPIGWEAGWAPEPVWTPLKIEKYLSPKVHYRVQKAHDWPIS
jgi:hypothetical protein